MKSVKKKVVMTTFLFLFIHIFSVSAFADTKDILNTFQFESNSAFQNFIRQFAWSAAKGLHWLVGGMEDVVYNINSTLGGFFTSDSVKFLQEKKMLPIAIALIVILVLFIGIMTMMKPQQFTTIISNLVVGIVIAFSLPALLSAAYGLTNQAIIFINSDSSGTLQKVSDQVLLDNVTDTTLYDKAGFKSTTLKYNSYYAMPGVNGKRITEIDPTELVNPEEMKHPDVWKNKINIDTNGKQTLKELNSGKWGFVDVPIFSEYYYRWKFDWVNIFTTLLVTGFALIMSSIKIARLLYELAIHQTMTQIFALLDVMTAQRLKKCIQTLIATFGTLIAVFFMLQMYIIGMAYIKNVSNIFLRLILMIALAWAVIDGPNLFEQIFGVDAGIQSALRTVYGMKAAGGILAGGAAMLGGKGMMDAMRAKGLVGTAKSAVSRAGSVAGGIGGVAAGVVSGYKETAQRVNSVKSGIGNAAPSAAAAAEGAAGSRQAPFSENLKENGSIPETEHNSTQESPGTASQAAENIHQNTADPHAQGNTAENSRTQFNKSNTVGEALRSAVSGRVQQSSPVNSARRAYSLTKGSVQAHGNKKVNREEQAQVKMQDKKLNHRNAINEVKKEEKDENIKKMISLGELKQTKNGIKKEKKELNETRSWAEQEYDSEHND